MRRVAIIGLGDSMSDAPKDMERWGLPWGGDSSYDLYFEPHSLADPRLTDDYIDGLADLYVPVLMQYAHDRVPNSIEYPSDAVRAVGGYIESSIGYILAYAIHEKVDAVEIYGVGCPFDDHYIYQRANLEYLIGFARASGIDVSVCPSSDLLTSYWETGVYGCRDGNIYTEAA